MPKTLISPDRVETYYQEFISLEEKEIRKLVRQFQRKQSQFAVYLVAVSRREEWSESEEEFFVTTSLFFWWVLGREFRLPAKISADRIEEADNAMYVAAESQPGSVSEVSEKIVTQSSQPALLGFVLRLFEENDLSEQVRQEEVGIMMLSLRTVLDLLAEAAG